ncbi:MAG: heavy-metal-associated domain-containing protein [Variovorax sp.]|nr:heavy-metal-associated domain-containing protein [Variovorax sp.]
MATFRVPDMTCGHCASAITKAVASIDKAARIEVSVPHKLVSVQSTADETELLDAIREAGYSPERVDAAPARQAASAGCCCAGRSAGQSSGAPGSSCCG